MTIQAEEEHLAIISSVEPVYDQWTRDGPSTQVRSEVHTPTFDIEEPTDAPPDWSFQVAIPMSGGLDSSTCYAMARNAGLAPQAYYIDTGAPYSILERWSLSERGVEFVSEKLVVDYQ